MDLEHPVARQMGLSIGGFERDRGVDAFRLRTQVDCRPLAVAVHTDDS